MNKDKIIKRISVEADGDIAIPSQVEFWKLESNITLISAYCRVAIREQTDNSENMSAAQKAYADISGGSHEEG